MMFLFLVAILGAQGACPPSSQACLGLANGVSCTIVESRPVYSLKCGICEDKNDGCGNQCKPNQDQSTCTAEKVTCTKTATRAGGIGIASACGTTAVLGGDPLVQPTVLSSSGGVLNVNLAVKTSTLNATAFQFTSRMYCLENVCTSPGPTLKFKAGDVVTVTVKNDLPTESTGGYAVNTLRLPNTINLHTHGIHVDPTVDNVMETIAPGASKTYVYKIPVNHNPGTHWYHSHVHGPSVLHMGGGLSGALIVDGAAPSSSISAMTSTLVHMTHIALCTCNPTSDPFAVRSYVHLQALTGDTVPLNYVQSPGYTQSDVFLVNGQYQPRLNLFPGEWRKLDFVNAVGDTYLELEIRTAVGGGNSACSMYLLAIDGIYLQNGPRAITEFMMSIAGRASIAVQCPTAGTFYLQSYPKERAADFEATFQQNLVTLVVSGAAVTMAQPQWSSSDLVLPAYLKDLRGSPAIAATFEVGVDQTGATGGGSWLGVGKNCTGECGGRGGGCEPRDLNTFAQCAFEPFQGEKGHYHFTAPACSNVEMVLNGRGATPHPFHMHVHHFQIISYDSGNGASDLYDKWGQFGDWRDTIPAFAGRLKIRFKVDGWVGPVMIHCHYLLHEDMGMMDRWWAGDVGSTPCVATSISQHCDASVPSSAFSAQFTSKYVSCDGTTLPPSGTVSPTGTQTVGGPSTPTSTPSIPSPTPALTNAPTTSPPSTSNPPSPGTPSGTPTSPTSSPSLTTPLTPSNSPSSALTLTPGTTMTPSVTPAATSVTTSNQTSTLAPKESTSSPSPQTPVPKLVTSGAHSNMHFTTSVVGSILVFYIVIVF